MSDTLFDKVDISKKQLLD